MFQFLFNCFLSGRDDEGYRIDQSPLPKVQRHQSLSHLTCFLISCSLTLSRRVALWCYWSRLIVEIHPHHWLDLSHFIRRQPGQSLRYTVLPISLVIHLGHSGDVKSSCPGQRHTPSLMERRAWRTNFEFYFLILYSLLSYFNEVFSVGCYPERFSDQVDDIFVCFECIPSIFKYFSEIFRYYYYCFYNVDRPCIPALFKGVSQQTCICSTHVCLDDVEIVHNKL